MADADDATSLDAFYGGRLMLRQPVKGHRSGTDAVLLAAAVPRDTDGLVIDAGAGVGAVGLGVALACPRARVLLVENEPDTVRLAKENIVENDVADRASVASCDLLDRDMRRELSRKAVLVVSNPPFYDAAAVRRSPSARKDAASVLAEGATLNDWLEACLDLLAPKASLIVIHAVAALPAILATFDRHLGAIAMRAIHPRPGEPAKRVLVRGTQGRRSAMTIAPPLFLHDGDAFSREVDAVHRGEACVDF